MTANKTTAEVLGRVREAICTAYNTMSEAEKLIASAGLHDKWHEKDIPHRAFHDLLFKRSDLKEALALLDTVQAGEDTNCPFCAGAVQRTDHLDADDNIKSSTVRCKPCNYTMPFEKFTKRAHGLIIREKK